MFNAKQYEKAHLLLESSWIYPGLPPLPKLKFEVKWRIFIYPSFEPYVSWSMIQTKDKYLVRRVIWDQRKEVVGDEPLTYGAEIIIDKTLVDEIYASLSRISMNPFIQDSFGLDGTSKGIEFGSNLIFGSKRTISWWGTPDPTWTPFVKWFNKYVPLINSLFPDPTLEIPTNV